MLIYLINGNDQKILEDGPELRTVASSQPVSFLLYRKKNDWELFLGYLVKQWLPGPVWDGKGRPLTWSDDHVANITNSLSSEGTLLFIVCSPGYHLEIISPNQADYHLREGPCSIQSGCYSGLIIISTTWRYIKGCLAHSEDTLSRLADLTREVLRD